MKILFLDIDGVCNSSTYVINKGVRPGVYDIDPVPATLVKNIIAKTGCKVVLSSVWRLSAESREQVRKYVCDFIDVTPEFRGPRGAEVKQWLVKHPEVERYAILDDDADFYNDQPLFKTSFDTGLTPDIANAVISYLNETNSPDRI